MAKFDHASTDALDLAHERTNIRVRNTSAMNFSFFLSMGLVLWVGGNKVIAGEISVGTLASFLTFMTILQMPVRQLGLLVNSFARASTCGTRLFDLLDLEVAVRDKPDAGELVVSEGVLRFEDVAFHYPTSPDRDVLSGISSRRSAATRSASSARRAAASRRSPTSFRASTTSPAAASPSTGRTFATSRSTRCARRSASCSRIRSCSPRPSRTTSSMATPGPRNSGSGAPANTPSCTTMC